ncbi:MAG TPA: hypothetical protein DDZ39_01705 [Flavobacteriaceae bacterium]|jgi:hypothetical protein|nr:hypothetical protein [Flavobacteriaceae bacterium]
MFNLFRKKKVIQENDYIFLKAIMKALSNKYPYLLPQVSKEFILDKTLNQLGDIGTYTFTLNAKLETKYSNKSLPQFYIIKDISIWNNLKGKFEQIELHILEGMIAGIKVTSEYSDLDLKKIDISKVKEKHFNNHERDNLKKIIGSVTDNLLSKLDIEGTFKIKIPEGEFFTIKDLGDGNYLSMDNDGAVYGMIHDPYEVEKLFDNKEVFFEALKYGKFNIYEYFNKKMSV